MDKLTTHLINSMRENGVSWVKAARAAANNPAESAVPCGIEDAETALQLFEVWCLAAKPGECIVFTGFIDGLGTHYLTYIQP